MKMRADYRILISVGMIGLSIFLTGCSTTPEERTAWFMSLSSIERLLVFWGPVAMLFTSPFLLIRIFGMGEQKSKNEAYFFYLVITIIIIVVILLAIWIATLLWAVVLWIVKNFIMIAIVLLSIFLLISLATYPNYGSNQDKTNWTIRTAITTIVLAILVLWQRGVFSALRVGLVTIAGAMSLLLIFLVISSVQALSEGYYKKRKWWFFSALVAAALLSVFTPKIIQGGFPDAGTRIEEISFSYIQYFLYGSVGGFFLGCGVLLAIVL